MIFMHGAGNENRGWLRGITVIRAYFTRNFLHQSTISHCCKKCVPVLPKLFFLALPGYCLTRFALFLVHLCTFGSQITFISPVPRSLYRWESIERWLMCSAVGGGETLFLSLWHNGALERRRRVHQPLREEGTVNYHAEYARSLCRATDTTPFLLTIHVT